MSLNCYKNGLSPTVTNIYHGDNFISNPNPNPSS